VTNCLNFASPERPEVMRSFSDVIDGMKEACEAFGTPVVSGNVSFYNETEGRGILPTPTIGMVGLIDDTRKIVTNNFKNEGDVIAILGVTSNDLSVSEFARTVAGVSTDEMIASGRVPVLDLSLELKVQHAMLRLAEEMLLSSAHDCAEGGLAVAIAESCFSSLNYEACGAAIELSSKDLSREAVLFAESPSRIVISFHPENLERVREIAGDCPFEVIGRVEDDVLRIAIDGEEAIASPISELEGVWESSLAKALDA
jgi:phosphoribosylformylglycinamidine (FGAM) synthase-like enzyme